MGPVALRNIPIKDQQITARLISNFNGMAITLSSLHRSYLHYLKSQGFLFKVPIQMHPYQLMGLFESVC